MSMGIETTARIRVAIADDHVILRDGLKDLLAAEPDMVVVAEAGSGAQALEILRRGDVDVMVLDIAMPGFNGLDVLLRIRTARRATKVLVLTGQDLRQFAVKVLRQGAAGVLSKGDDPCEIAEAIRSIAATGRHLTPFVNDLVAESLSRDPSVAHPPHESLSNRELQMLIHYGQGQGSRAVAGDLNLSPKTVSTYRTVLLQKLGLRNNSDMVHYTLQHRLIE